MIKVEEVTELDITQNSRGWEYQVYLRDHITNVIRSWNEILRPALVSNEPDLNSSILINLDRRLIDHDRSKYDYEEFDAYLNYFYPADGSDRDFNNVPEEIDKEFDKAWLHHQKCNPHHWQYYVLVKDSGDTYALDMSIEDIFEMLCDWHSFSVKNPESTAYKWYQDNKKKMVLSDTTRSIVEKYIEFLKTPLESIASKYTVKISSDSEVIKND